MQLTSARDRLFSARQKKPLVAESAKLVLKFSHVSVRFLS